MLPAAGKSALVPAAVATGALVLVGAGYAVASSLGLIGLTGREPVGLDAYRALLAGDGATDLGSSARFTVWVSFAATVAAVVIALGAIAWLDRAGRGRRRVAAGVLHVNIAIPHVVWAVALGLVLAQSGLVSRALAAVGLVDAPSDFPVLVHDRFGLGLIVHYATKEAPFLALIGLALLRAQPPELRVVAETLGATGWRRFRLVTLPTVAPGIAAGAGLVLAFIVGAYEAPTILGVSSPRMLSVLGLDLFNSPDLARRPQAMALGVVMAVAVTVLVAVAARMSGRRA